MRAFRLGDTASNIGTLVTFLSLWFGGNTRLADITPSEFTRACEAMRIVRMRNLQISAK